MKNEKICVLYMQFIHQIVTINIEYPRRQCVSKVALLNNLEILRLTALILTGGR